MLFTILNKIIKLLQEKQNEQNLRDHIKNSVYSETLYDREWLITNHDKLMEALPEVWTLESNINYVLFGLQMKLLNVHWENREQLKSILVFLENMGLICRSNGFQIKRNVNNDFNPAINP
jgi:hypothetical protein